MDVGSIRTNDSIYNAIDNISRIKIDIARIQETHTEITDISKLNNYEIFFGVGWVGGGGKHNPKHLKQYL